MKYDLVSDLHVDINRKVDIDWSKIKNSGSEILIVAGDTSNTPSITYDVLETISKFYKYIIWVDGNHEHYHHYDHFEADEFANVGSEINLYKSWSKKINNLIYLTGSNSFKFENVLFVGANSWYDFSFVPNQYTFQQAYDSWKQNSNDSVHIVFDKSPDDYALLHATQIAEVVKNAQDDNTIDKLVVVTHTVPSRKGLIIRNDYVWDTLNGAYGNSKMELVWKEDINNKIIHSVFGHTHSSYDFYDYNGIRFIANPRGYHGWDGDVTKWKPIQLDTDDKRGEFISSFGEIETND